MRIAGLMPVRNYEDRCSAFSTLRSLCDFVIVLDHNSEQEFKFRNECDEYLTVRNGELWNATANRTTLMYRAFVHNCEWVVTMDDDLIFSSNFQTRSDVERIIGALTHSGMDTAVFTLRDLWTSPKQYRADGIWSRKSFTTVRRNWFFYEEITLRHTFRDRLHTAVYPNNYPRVGKKYIQHFPDHYAYHSGCLTEPDRLARVEKYRVEDAANCSKYEYMLDTTGLQLRDVPADDHEIITKCFNG